jgi:hypothetical protein
MRRSARTRRWSSLRSTSHSMSLRASGSEIEFPRLAASSLRLLPTRSTACLSALRSSGDVAALVAMAKAGVDRKSGGGMAGAGGAPLARPAGLGTAAVVVPRSAPGESDSGAGAPLWACSLCSVVLCSVVLCSGVLRSPALCSAPLCSAALCSVALPVGAGAITAGLACGSGTWVCATQICAVATRGAATSSKRRTGVTDPPRQSPPAILRNLFGW